MNTAYFITGTDTNAGKTWATVALMRGFRRLGKTVVGMKPVAAGCSWQDGQWLNDDALLLQAHASVAVDYRLINPYAYPEPVSPHIAGQANPLDSAKVLACFDKLKAQADVVLVEGAGGWLSPVNSDEDNSDLAQALGLPVIVVVAIRLGSINHAKLTWQAIEAKFMHCAGWIAACVDPGMAYPQETIGAIQMALAAPLLGVLPYQESADFDRLADGLTLTDLAVFVSR